jgi:aerobic carbon-monoxide dehydrogenase small subunit
MALRQITLRVNGQEYTGQAEVRKTLADFIREDCGLTGTHLGCEHGVCGACTILMNGEAVRSCLLFAVQAEGTELMTVEGLADGDQLHPIQQAYWDHHALQCGFCTPGFLMTTYAFLRDSPHPSEREIREGIAGNLCRCTGYQNIVKAVAAAAETLAAGARLEPAWAAPQRAAAGPANGRARAAAADTTAGQDGSAAGPRLRRSAQARSTKKSPTARKAPGRQRRSKR